MNIILGHEAHDPTHLNVKLNYVAVSTIVFEAQNTLAFFVIRSLKVQCI